MQLHLLGKVLLKTIGNIPGWRTHRKIVVFESDDWGEVRLPSKEAYEALLKNGLGVDKCRHCKYDSLESEEDLLRLFDLLRSFKDSRGNPAVFSTFNVIANPDFEKIRKDGFENYYYELYPDTLKRYPGSVNLLNIWRNGIDEGMVCPQSHGREHLNVALWMQELRSGNRDARLAFDHNMFGLNRVHSKRIKGAYLAAFDFFSQEEKEGLKNIICDGLDKFEEVFGYRAECFVAPNSIFSSELEPTLASCGIRFIGTSRFKKEASGGGRYTRKFRYLGQCNNNGQIYILRNCVFEPCASKGDSVDSCLKDISVAFKLRKPAIINTHRVNFMGSFDPKNREHGLQKLYSLLKSITKIWPEVEFMNSVELGNLVSGVPSETGESA